MTYKFLRSKVIVTFCLFLVTCNLYALEKHKKLWLAISTEHPFTQDKKWLYSFYTQLRLINEPHSIQTFFFEEVLGYQFANDKSFWLGFRWIGNRPGNHFYRSRRFIQQLKWDMINSESFHTKSRSRLEEIRRSDQHETEIRFRQRFSAEFEQFFFNHINPYIFDEIFFQMHKTNFTSHQMVSENRVFIGFNYYLTKKQWLEIGYINQFECKTPLSPNQLSHILSFTYDF